jgi:hypothetical protein
MPALTPQEKLRHKLNIIAKQRINTIQCKGRRKKLSVFSTSNGGLGARFFASIRVCARKGIIIVGRNNKEGVRVPYLLVLVK